MLGMADKNIDFCVGKGIISCCGGASTFGLDTEAFSRELLVCRPIFPRLSSLTLSYIPRRTSWCVAFSVLALSFMSDKAEHAAGSGLITPSLSASITRSLECLGDCCFREESVGSI